MLKKPKLLVLFFSVVFIFFSAVMLEQCKPSDKKSAAPPPGNNAFIGDQSCKNCHQKQHDKWEQSHHYMAMLPPDDSTVKGDFNNTSFTADGITSKFFKKDGKFIINTEGDDGKNHDYEVKYTFGFTPLQQYLVEFPGGRMQVPRLSWDVKQKKWFNQYAGQKIPSHDWLHWTGNAQNWNTMCASCHSTNLQKNYNIDGDSYHTTYSAINVSCESCHGAGKLHIDYVNGDDYKTGQKIKGSLLQLDSGAKQLTQINTCMPCHARKSDLSASLIQSDEIMDNYIPEIPDTEHFYADGQVNDEDYIYTSFTQSKMFRHGIKCSNCHDPHSTKTILTSSQTCLQCHAKTYEAPSHTFHAASITAVDCQSCHMPGKLYMGNDLRHDHSFRVPRPDLSVKYATPNACNNCHKNKTAQWAAAAIIKWYGPARKYHFSEDLVPGSKLDESSEAHLVKLFADTTVPDIIKATAAKYLGSIQTQTSLAALIKCLSNKDAQTRYRALRSLENFQQTSWLNAVGPLLTDKVRAVRIAAADMYSSIPSNQVPAQYAQAFTFANNELQSYLIYQADFSVGNLMIADHYLQQQDYKNAEKFYLRGLKKDSLMNYGRLNLSAVYNAQGKNAEAMQVLKTAAIIDPKNDRIFYNLALLSNELNDNTAAGKYFAKAVELKSSNPKVYYNYGLLLNGNKNYREAENVLLKGISLDPGSAQLLYALTFVYMQSGNMIKARETGVKLKQLDSGNPEYTQLFKNLGI
jgi:tetratricopeptide (TPR) repeat protein